MADTDSYKMYKQRKTEENRANPSKFYTHFLYKALIVSIFLVVLPLFPSQAPEFINQNILSRSWELLHLLFVGIAVSYGLFSHRNDDVEKENNNHAKFDNAQTYVSRFLQVPSVFDDENENLSGSDENKVQTWSSQYYRNEPVVVVAKDHSVLDQEQRTTASRISDKPLLLPVRSLKSRVSDSDNIETNVKSSSSISRSGSNSGSRRFSSSSNNIKNVELGGFVDENVNFEEKLNENVVLPSPIPWRSRSGRMEMKEEVDSPPMEDSEFNRLETRSLRPQMSRSSRPNSTSSSPKLSSSPSLSSPKKLPSSSSSSSSSSPFSSEPQAKNSEDSVRKKSFYRPPPPPPPPPPPMTHKSSSMKLSSSYTSVQRDNLDGFSMGRLVRTARSFDAPISGMKDREIEDGFDGKSERRSKQVNGRKNVTFDQTSFKTEQLSRDTVTYMPKPTFMEFPKQDKQEFVDKVTVETDGDSEMEEEEEDDDGDQIGESPFISNMERCYNNDEAGPSNVSDGGPDVDKKADEFIAKFREQIRLQRIESIKRSSAQISRNSSG
ncbi:hypothetical protein QYF36_018992 [Acer negundo]|nr:hypothetical protein QYF36_018992 [Acer negundo]